VGDAKRIPRNKPKIAAAFGMAAECMGFRFFITDAGSNPETGPIPLEMVSAVKSAITIPYVAAGGIKTAEQARAVIKAGADIIQVGTAFEKESSVAKIKDMVKAVREGAKSRS
jgi:phosphoglycerol geranylgeranyltransferase